MIPAFVWDLDFMNKQYPTPHIYLILLNCSEGVSFQE